MTDKQLEVATLGGGCFWCLDAVYRDVAGVERVVSGYAGGAINQILMLFTDAFLTFPVIAAVWLFQRMLFTRIFNPFTLPEEFVWWENMLITLDLDPIMLALIIFSWMPYARLVNGMVIQQKHADYVTAARAMGAGNGRIIIHPKVSGNEGTDQPRPDCSLVVSAVAFKLVAAITADVVIIVGGKAAQAVRGEQMARAGIDDGALLFGGEWAVRQGNGKQLVGAQFSVWSVWSVDDVVAVTHFWVPEALEASFNLLGQGGVFVGGMAEGLGKFSHGHEGVVPQGADFHGFADAVGDDPVANFGIHPGELDAFFAGVEQAVGGVHSDVVAGSPAVPADDFFENWEKFTQEFLVVGGLVVGANGFDVPEGGVDGIVFGVFAGVRDGAGKHTLA